MKKILQKMGMVIAVLLGSLPSYAYDFEVDGIYYDIVSFDDMTCKVVSGKEKYKYRGDVDIPSIVTYNNRQLTVTEIGASAFYYCEALTSVIIPNSVIKIGEEAFAICSSLISVTIPNSVDLIGGGAFSNCSSLTSVTIPDFVTEIGRGAFLNCSSLTSVIIPNSVTIIEESTFQYCSSLTSVTIPDSVKEIGETAFSTCSSLTSVTIPNSVTTIGRYAFSKCSSLSSVTIPNSVIYIGENAFASCSALTSVNIPDSLTTIERSTFSECSSLASITIGNSVIKIEENAFSSCSSLLSVTIPDSVIKIGRSAFTDCSSLTSVIIGNSVTEIDYCAFENCRSLSSVTIGNMVDIIDNTVFRGCKSITKFILLHSLKSIIYDWYHFIDWMNAIQELYTDRPIYYSSDADGSTLGRTYMDLPNLEKLVLGESVPSVEGIRDYSKLTTIKSYALDPPTLPEMSNAQYMNVQVKVPYEALEAYQQADVWKNFWNLEGFDPNGIDAEMISLNIQEAELNIGETVQLEATVLPEDTTDKTIEWKSSNEEIVNVDEFGLVTAISEGSATIMAILGNLTATCEVTVYTPIIEAEKVVLNVDKAELNIGETVQLEATVLPEDTTDKTLEWKSSNEEVAIVDESGLVTAIGAGTAIITATCGEASAQCEITVIEENGVENIFANPTRVRDNLHA